MLIVVIISIHITLCLLMLVHFLCAHATRWPDDGPRTQDDDPIDFDGHGTHCADIAAGLLGVAPGASLLAVKVCSAIGPSCSGVALLQGIEYATDPNGDGDPSGTFALHSSTSTNCLTGELSGLLAATTRRGERKSL